MTLPSHRKARKMAMLRERDGDNCCYCGGLLYFKAPDEKTRYENWAFAATLEHVRTRSSALENLKLAHRKCNSDASWLKVSHKPLILHFTVMHGRAPRTARHLWNGRAARRYLQCCS